MILILALCAALPRQSPVPPQGPPVVIAAPASCRCGPGCFNGCVSCGCAVAAPSVTYYAPPPPAVMPAVTYTPAPAPAFRYAPAFTPLAAPTYTMPAPAFAPAAGCPGGNCPRR